MTSSFGDSLYFGDSDSLFLRIPDIANESFPPEKLWTKIIAQSTETDVCNEIEMSWRVSKETQSPADGDR